jgi:hypothetical protein
MMDISRAPPYALRTLDLYLWGVKYIYYTCMFKNKMYCKKTFF